MLYCPFLKILIRYAMKNIAIAGASGFVGQALIKELLLDKDIHIIALTRGDKQSTSRITWKKCDLFSRSEILNALHGADQLIYLVHSMEPSARLDQASFADYDLILADNFGRCARELNISKVVYLGGIIPPGKNVSLHLNSRLEIETVFKEYFPQYIFLRAGLIIGALGSSYNILVNLVKRLPILVCPSWTQNLTSPVHISYVVSMIKSCSDTRLLDGEIINLSSKDEITYFDLLKKTARILSKKRLFFRIGIPIITVSRFWVSLFSGASRRLVYPLLESLKHPMVANNSIQIPQNNLTVEESLEKAALSGDSSGFIFNKNTYHESFVRSVQRATLPIGMSASDAATEYMTWLPRFLSPFVKVSVEGDWITFSLFFSMIKILILKRVDHSTSDFQTFHIKGGLLALKHNKGRLEFREVLNKSSILISIHDFYPSLPWYLYRYTQAVFHLFVMNSFKKHLKRLSHNG
jgi:uncharacterized protein YbjT (DUF2867 family)